ncbi:hypothetical protein, partial [Caballeronia sp. GAFFF1]|uniref:hypothetical protein n=1 Tax=Caballeronia sp. GAFFF1 TaxID=2921779 RepID=UPI0020280766
IFARLHVESLLALPWNGCSVCVEYAHYRLNLQTFPSNIDLAAKNALCAIKLEKVKDAVKRDRVTGVVVPDDTARAQAMCAIQRIPSFPTDLMMHSCGRRARWFQKRPLDASRQTGSGPKVHGDADRLRVDSR